jgi:LPXTG-site transpeptidase (sortase) family protein
MSKKYLFSSLFGAAMLIGGTVLLIVIMRTRAVNIISAPPVPTHVATTPTAGVATSTAPTPTVAPAQGFISGSPTRISIPSLNMSLSVIPGYYDASSDSWTLTNDKVQFATPTALPNNAGGNTFLYGHARSNIFGVLPKIQAGAIAIVSTSNGHRFYYRLNSTRVVDPSNSAPVFNYQGKPILTLQTCVGLLYQSRELLTFDLQEVA